MANETKNTITLFFVEVGVLADRQVAINDENHIPAYDDEWEYFDENTCVFLEGGAAIEFALAYTMRGVTNTYAICKELQVPEEWVSADDIEDIKASGIFDGWTDVYLDERQDCKHIILDIYKSAENTIKFDFTDKLKAVVSND